MGVAECSDGPDAEVSDVCGCLCGYCNGCGDFSFGCGALAGGGPCDVCCDADGVGGTAFAASSSWLIGGDGGAASLVGFEVVAVTYDDGGCDEKEEACGYQGFGATAGSAPLLEREAPEGGEENDAGHVEGPAGEVVPAHFGLAHGVEEKLEVPDDAGERGQDVVEDKCAPRDAVVGGRVEGVVIDKSVTAGAGGAHGVAAGCACELAHGFVFEDEDC